MHRISGFDSMSARFIVYLRELERLAGEVEDHLLVLRDNPDAACIKYVTDRLDERLDSVYNLGRVEQEDEKSS